MSIVLFALCLLVFAVALVFFIKSKTRWIFGTIMLVSIIGAVFLFANSVTFRRFVYTNFAP